MADANTAEWINAVASVATAFATLGIGIVAWYQISSIRDEGRKWETIKICNQYDTDPILFQCATAIRKLTKGLDYSLDTVRPAMQEIRTLVNYFDVIAVGVTQGVYIEAIVKDNLEPVICTAVDKFLTSEFRDEISLSALECLMGLRRKWLSAAPPPTTRYKQR